MKRYLVTLTTQEQATLRELIAKRSSKAEIVKRAYVLLSLDENRLGGRLSDDAIRQQYQVGQRLLERALCTIVLPLRSMGGSKRSSRRRRLMDGWKRS